MPVLREQLRCPYWATDNCTIPPVVLSDPPTDRLSSITHLHTAETEPLEFKLLNTDSPLPKYASPPTVRLLPIADELTAETLEPTLKSCLMDNDWAREASLPTLKDSLTTKTL
jgi:hypothetical protein